MVIWLIGLSGAGKSTIGRCIYEELKTTEPNTVLLDGDEIRRIFKADQSQVDYSIEGRAKNAARICELCAWLDRQKINVVCAILSLFEETREWNRRAYSQYFEIYISVPLEVLMKKDPKGLYKKAASGEIDNVVGIQIPFEEPRNPDLVIDNSGFDSNPKQLAVDALNRARLKANSK